MPFQVVNILFVGIASLLATVTRYAYPPIGVLGVAIFPVDDRARTVRPLLLLARA